MKKSDTTVAKEKKGKNARTPFSLHGVITALITPFQDGKIDEVRFKHQIERQIEAGVRGIVPVGTTGESPTLSHEEHTRVIELAVACAAGRVSVIAGTGSNSTQEAIMLTRAAERAGADAVLLVVPYYNKPRAEGLVQHFTAVARSVALPIILYNIPGRSGVDMGVETVAILARTCPNIVGIKEASGSCARVTELRQRLGNDFLIFSGDDALTLPFLALGAHGVISVLSNLLPRWVVKETEAARAGNMAEALRYHDQSVEITRLLFAEGNPAGIKAAMKAAHLDSGEVRLPLVEVSRGVAEEITRWVALCADL